MTGVGNKERNTPPLTDLIKVNKLITSLMAKNSIPTGCQCL
jgi:hypothetical protein